MKAFDMPVAILAGGRATRLQPVTEEIPKLLVEVAGEPFLSHQIRLLKTAGLERLVLCVGHLGQQIVDRYGDGSKWGVEIDYSFDGPKLLGTGGALARALPLLGEAFYVLYGDSYLPIDYQAVGRAFLEAGKQGMMTVFENREQFDASNVLFEDGEIKVYDKEHRGPKKMNHIDYGLSVLSAKAFASCPAGEAVDLAVIQKLLVASGEMAGYEVRQRFYEIGSHSGLAELDALLKTGKPIQGW